MRLVTAIFLVGLMAAIVALVIAGYGEVIRAILLIALFLFMCW